MKIARSACRAIERGYGLSQRPGSPKRIVQYLDTVNGRSSHSDEQTAAAQRNSLSSPGIRQHLESPYCQHPVSGLPGRFVLSPAIKTQAICQNSLHKNILKTPAEKSHSLRTTMAAALPAKPSAPPLTNRLRPSPIPKMPCIQSSSNSCPCPCSRPAPGLNGTDSCLFSPQPCPISWTDATS